MAPIRIHRHAYVLVCDGSKALVFRNAGDALALNLQVVEAAFEPHPPTRDLGAERPGRVREAMGTFRSAVEEPDYHDLAETDFLRGVAHKLEALVHARDITDLVIVAPPRALGVLRTFLAPAVRAVVSAEIGKDLARLSTVEIETQLAGLNRLP
ncbi:MAG TPA: host attachment protein [Devosiaceae bacterium]|nr:host attachment protein [Devosiaceae bacterium]